jgi:hypothetical protein
MPHGHEVEAYEDYDHEGDGHAKLSTRLERIDDRKGEPHGADRHGGKRVTMQRLAEQQSGEDGRDERRGAEHDDDVGHRCQPERQDEGDEASGEQEGAQQERASGVADGEPPAAALPKHQRHDGHEQQQGSPEGDVPRRQVDALHDHAGRAVGDGGAKGTDNADSGGAELKSGRCHRDARRE